MTYSSGSGSQAGSWTGRGARVEDLLKVAGEQVPTEVVVVVAVGTEDHHAADPLGCEDRLQGLYIDQILVERLAFSCIDRAEILTTEDRLIVMLF